MRTELITSVRRPVEDPNASDLMARMEAAVPPEHRNHTRLARLLENGRKRSAKLLAALGLSLVGSAVIAAPVSATGTAQAVQTRIFSEQSYSSVWLNSEDGRKLKDALNDTAEQASEMVAILAPAVPSPMSADDLEKLLAQSAEYGNWVAYNVINQPLVFGSPSHKNSSEHPAYKISLEAQNSVKALLSRAANEGREKTFHALGASETPEEIRTLEAACDAAWFSGDIEDFHDKAQLLLQAASKSQDERSFLISLVMSGAVEDRQGEGHRTADGLKEQISVWRNRDAGQGFELSRPTTPGLEVSKEFDSPTTVAELTSRLRTILENPDHWRLYDRVLGHHLPREGDSYTASPYLPAVLETYTALALAVAEEQQKEKTLAPQRAFIKASPGPAGPAEIRI